MRRSTWQAASNACTDAIKQLHANWSSIFTRSSSASCARTSRGVCPRKIYTEEIF